MLAEFGAQRFSPVPDPSRQEDALPPGSLRLRTYLGRKKGWSGFSKAALARGAQRARPAR
jgi:hypothetical protein